MAVTDAAGTVKESYRYSAFGQPTIFNASGVEVGVSQVKQPYMFTGARWDEESSLYQMRLRYYDPVAGRFVSRDPLGMWGDAAQNGNGQSYCGGDPVNFVDPMGDRGSPADAAAAAAFGQTARAYQDAQDAGLGFYMDVITEMLDAQDALTPFVDLGPSFDEMMDVRSFGLDGPPQTVRGPSSGNGLAIMQGITEPIGVVLGGVLMAKASIACPPLGLFLAFVAAGQVTGNVPDTRPADQQARSDMVFAVCAPGARLGGFSFPTTTRSSWGTGSKRTTELAGTHSGNLVAALRDVAGNSTREHCIYRRVADGTIRAGQGTRAGVTLPRRGYRMYGHTHPDNIPVPSPGDLKNVIDDVFDGVPTHLRTRLEFIDTPGYTTHWGFIEGRYFHVITPKNGGTAVRYFATRSGIPTRDLEQAARAFGLGQ